MLHGVKKNIRKLLGHYGSGFQRSAMCIQKDE